MMTFGLPAPAGRTRTFILRLPQLSRSEEVVDLQSAKVARTCPMVADRVLVQRLPVHLSRRGGPRLGACEERDFAAPPVDLAVRELPAANQRDESLEQERRKR